MEAIKTLENAEYGIQSIVMLIGAKYHVILRDTDSDNIIPTRIYNNEAQAVDYAEKLVAA